AMQLPRRGRLPRRRAGAGAGGAAGHDIRDALTRVVSCATMTEPASTPAGRDFIRDLIDRDRAAGLHGGRVATRFPPEPNRYLHIGHAKSICLNFGLAIEYGGTCNVRLDDTNPETEDEEYVAAIQEGVRWLGFEFGDRFFRASDYFERFYELALQLIR